MHIKNNIFLIGVFLAYIVLCIIPSNKFAPVPFIIFFLLSSVYFNDIKNSLLLSAIFSFPYSWGKALLYMDDLSILIVTPLTGFIILTSLFITKKTKFYYTLPDIFLLLFFLWGIISFVIINTTPEVLDGIFKIGIGILLYLNIKNKITDFKFMKLLILVLFSISIFESTLTIFQFILGHPIGLFIEESIRLYPFGKVSSENTSIFRSSGTFIEPTFLARFLTMLLPFILIRFNTIFTIRREIRILIIIMSLISIFVSFTRFSWGIALFVLIYLFLTKRPNINFSRIKRPEYLIITSILLIFGFITLFPYFEQRIVTSSISFQEGRSFDMRIKLIQEAVNLIIQYPIFGVGLNRFIPVALENNITGFFQTYITSVHNVSLMIASEMGIPALIFFIGFILFSYKNYFKNRKFVKKYAERNILDAAAIGGIVYLLESMMGTIFLSPHLYLFFLYMAIINS